MPLSEDAMQNKIKYSIDYAKRKYTRVPLDLTKEKYDEVKKASELLGESVNGFIKASIDRRLSEMKENTQGGS